jgi:hypothetical protein
VACRRVTPAALVREAVAEEVARHDVVRTARSVGLADAAAIAVAERLRASAIATLELEHFGPIAIEGRPLLLPRDA